MEPLKCVYTHVLYIDEGILNYIFWHHVHFVICFTKVHEELDKVQFNSYIPKLI
jgi:hypothetical protein